MSSRHTLVLIVVAVVALLAAFWASSLRTPVTDSRTLGPLYPELSETINTVSEIEIVAPGGDEVARIVKGEEQWRVASKHDYPADTGKVRELLIELAGADVLERKTADAAYYSRLGVGDVSDAEAGGVLLRLGGLVEPVALIVGEIASTGGTYVRRADDPQSLLIDAELEVAEQGVDWLRRDIVDIASSRVHEVTITHPDGETLRISKDSRTQSNFDVADVPEGRELTFAGAANSIATALTALRLDDLMPLDSVDLAAAGPVRLRYRLFDGTVLELRAAGIDEQPLLHLRASFDDSLAQRFAEAPAAQPEQAAAESDGGTGAENGAGESAESGTDAGAPAETAGPEAPGEDDGPADAAAEARAGAGALDQRVQGWVYAIPSYKHDQLTRRMADLLKAEDAEQ